MRCSYLVARADPEPGFQEASARRQPPVPPAPPGLVGHAPEQLAARRHQLLHPAHQSQRHAEPAVSPRSDEPSVMSGGEGEWLGAREGPERSNAPPQTGWWAAVQDAASSS